MQVQNYLGEDEGNADAETEPFLKELRRFSPLTKQYTTFGIFTLLSLVQEPRNTLQTLIKSGNRLAPSVNRETEVFRDRATQR